MVGVGEVKFKGRGTERLDISKSFSTKKIY